MLKKYVDFIQNMGYNEDAKREKAPGAGSALYLRGTLKKMIGGESDVQRKRKSVLRPPVTAYLKAQQSRISEIFLHSELFVRRT